MTSVLEYLNPIKIVKFRTVIGVLQPKKLKTQIISEQCYHNTLRIIEYYPCANIEYVEGWLINKKTGTEVPHVWCKYLNKYFDLTMENAPHMDTTDFIYYPVLVGTFDDLKAKGYVFTAYWMPLMNQILDTI